MAPVLGQAAVMCSPLSSTHVGEEALVALLEAAAHEGGWGIACREPSVMIEKFAIVRDGEDLLASQLTNAQRELRRTR